MIPTNDNQSVFFLGSDYSLTFLNSLDCSMIFRNSADQALAVLSGCNNKISAITPSEGHTLSKLEKDLLFRFIIDNQFEISTDTAYILGITIIRRLDGREEYLTEKRLRNLLKQPIECESLYIGSLNATSLNIASYSQCGVCNFGQVNVSKFIIGDNCGGQFDWRDNDKIEVIKVGDSFSGSINLSRTSAEYIDIADNCRCDLTIYDCKRCFYLNIGDIYSGKLDIKDTCFHSINIGYYSYAYINMVDNWGHKEVSIGPSFRGKLNISGLNVHSLRLGQDCKGIISLSNGKQESNTHFVEIGNNFAGVMDMRGTSTVEALRIGEHARGKLNLWSTTGVKTVEFDKYYSGYADFSESKIERLRFAEGSSGELVLLNCPNLKLLILPRNHATNLTVDSKPLDIRRDDSNVYFYFSIDSFSALEEVSLYQKIYRGVKDIFFSNPH